MRLQRRLPCIGLATDVAWVVPREWFFFLYLQQGLDVCWVRGIGYRRIPGSWMSVSRYAVGVWWAEVRLGVGERRKGRYLHGCNWSLDVVFLSFFVLERNAIVGYVALVSRSIHTRCRTGVGFFCGERCTRRGRDRALVLDCFAFGWRGLAVHMHDGLFAHH